MKQFRLLLTILTLLAVGSMNTWAETKTWTLSYSDFNSTSYAANNGEHKKDGITYYSNQVMLQSSSMQFQKSKGYIYNKTPMPGNITKITLETTTNFTIYVGTTESPSSGTIVTSGATITGNYTYFYIKNGSARAETATITITYETADASCTAPEAALALSLSQETADLGKEGTAQVTFSTTGGNGAEIVYSVSPEAGAAISGTTATFTKAGTYTLTATQPTATTNGSTYCGGSVSKTITVTATPVLYFTTTPDDPITFPEVECGGNTPLSQKQQISVQGYNLTGDVAVTVAGDYKIARTASTALSEYAISLTLPKTNNGSINSTYTTVYVLSTPPRTE